MSIGEIHTGLVAVPKRRSNRIFSYITARRTAHKRCVKNSKLFF